MPNSSAIVKHDRPTPCRHQPVDPVVDPVCKWIGRGVIFRFALELALTWG